MQFTSVYTKLFSDLSILYLPGNPTSSTWRQTQYLFSVRSLLKQKEWTYESNLLAGTSSMIATFTGKGDAHVSGAVKKHCHFHL